MLRNPWAVLALLFFARFSMAVHFQSIPPIIPDLIAAWGIGYTEIGLLIGISMLAGIGLALPGGLLSRRLGDKRVLLLGLGALTAGSLLFAVAPNYPVAFAARLLGGVGMAVLNVQLTKLVADWFPPERLATAMGIFISAWPAGIALALSSLGFIAASIGWQGAVALTAAFSGAMLLVVGLLYRDQPGDLQTAVAGADRPAKVALWTLSGGELGLIVLAALVWGLPNVGIIVFGSFGPALLESRGMSIAVASLLIGIPHWVVIASVPAGGALADRTGRIYTAIVVGLVTMGVFLWASISVDLGWLWLMLVLAGLTAGAWPGPVMTLPGRVLSPQSRASGFGVFYTVFHICMAGLVPVAGWLRDVTGDPAMPLYYCIALAFVPLVPLAAFVALLRRRAAAAPQPAPEAA